jgi:hypothetical protein
MICMFKRPPNMSNTPTTPKGMPTTTLGPVETRSMMAAPLTLSPSTSQPCQPPTKPPTTVENPHGIDHHPSNLLKGPKLAAPAPPPPPGALVIDSPYGPSFYFDPDLLDKVNDLLYGFHDAQLGEGARHRQAIGMLDGTYPYGHEEHVHAWLLYRSHAPEVHHWQVLNSLREG